MKVAQVGFCLSAVLKISMVLYPAREQIYSFYKIKRSTSNHLLLTVILVTISFLVPSFYPNITSILGLIGGIMFGTAGYAIPIILKIVSIKNNRSGLLIFCYILLLLAVISIQVVSAYVSICLPEDD